ncbi:peptide chain release factor N(5)-glutamine methyltransferase [Kallipyga massiliensis]|uniref:peptide chain release factor N(5)-glutamine methyltransferase n=1 Tax=Kallipyga massiliensis TaxID=1472764 RepID=UPI0026F0AFC7|nr:peptide chain release factor N(5)-glutamine methyltransferase [Kallipyga massiliensis]
MKIDQAKALFPHGEGEIALSYLLDRPLSWVRTSGGFDLSDKQEEEVRKKARERESGRPLQYVLGRWDFYGRTFRVDGRALIPRPETELLVEAVLEKMKAGDRVLDLGTGTGVIPLTLALEARDKGIPWGKIMGTDLSREALELARENRALLSLSPEDVDLAHGDLFEAIDDREDPFDWIISNPPYVDPALKGRLQGELDYEPDLALYAPDHGRAVYERILAQAPAHLKEGGWLALEIGDDQGDWIRDRLAQRGFDEIEIRKDYSHRDRMAFGRWRPGREACLRI